MNNIAVLKSRLAASLLPAVLAAAMAPLGGCQVRKSAELPQPAVQMAVIHFAGTPLGPSSRPAAASEPALDTSDLVGVKVKIIALEKMPAEVFDPLAAHARLITASAGVRPVLATTQLTGKSRYGQLASWPAGESFLPAAAAAGRVRMLGELRGVLPAGVTASFRLVDKREVNDPLASNPARRSLCVDLFRAAGDSVPQVALSLEDVPPSDSARDANGARISFISQRRTAAGSAAGLQHETAIVDGPAGKSCLVLITPFSLSNGRIAAVAMVVEMTTGAGEEYAAAIESCKKDLADPAAAQSAAVQILRLVIAGHCRRD